ncbi:MAG: hypothetical protein ACI92E_001805 [Oceanicoccus sp.]|jgi:hypothetical protein
MFGHWRYGSSLFFYVQAELSFVNVKYPFRETKMSVPLGIAGNGKVWVTSNAVRMTSIAVIEYFT